MYVSTTCLLKLKRMMIFFIFIFRRRSHGKKEGIRILPDTHYEGKDQVYLDVDRMVNEGMSGGSVHMREDSTNIEEAV